MKICKNFIASGYVPGNFLISVEMWYIYAKFYKIDVDSKEMFVGICETEVLGGYLEEVPITDDLLRFYQSSSTDRFFKLSEDGIKMASIYVL